MIYSANDYRFYLEHHGVLGQKRGVRNGPPYPLKPGDHSASEKKAGWRKSLEGVGSALSKKKKTQPPKADVKKEEKPSDAISKEERERIIKSGSAKDVLKLQGQLTNDEYSQIEKRLEYEKKFKDKAEAGDVDNSKVGKLARLADKAEKISTSAEKFAQLYNKGATVYNSLFDGNLKYIKTKEEVEKAWKEKEELEARLAKEKKEAKERAAQQKAQQKAEAEKRQQQKEEKRTKKEEQRNKRYELKNKRIELQNQRLQKKIDREKMKDAEQDRKDARDEGRRKAQADYDGRKFVDFGNEQHNKTTDQTSSQQNQTHQQTSQNSNQSYEHVNGQAKAPNTKKGKDFFTRDEFKDTIDVPYKEVNSGTSNRGEDFAQRAMTTQIVPYSSNSDIRRKRLPGS